MSNNFYHAEIKDELSNEEVEKLRSIEDIELIGKMSLNPDNAKYNNDLLVINYQDEAINEMREYSRLQEGRFAENEDEIVVSESLAKKNKLKIGDRVELDLGKRFLDGEEIGPTSANTGREIFKSQGFKKFTLVGIYGDVYNKYSKLSFALGLQDKMTTFKTFIKFHSFEEAYKNRDNIQAEINQTLGKKVTLEFSESLINYYGVENEYWNNALEKLGSSVDNTIVFEDALYCIDTVDKMGFKIVGITDESTVNDYDIIDEKVDQYIESYDDLDYDLFK